MIGGVHKSFDNSDSDDEFIVEDNVVDYESSPELSRLRKKEVNNSDQTEDLDDILSEVLDTPIIGKLLIFFK